MNASETNLKYTYETTKQAILFHNNVSYKNLISIVKAGYRNYWIYFMLEKRISLQVLVVSKTTHAQHLI